MHQHRQTEREPSVLIEWLIRLQGPRGTHLKAVLEPGDLIGQPRGVLRCMLFLPLVNQSINDYGVEVMVKPIPTLHGLA